jgi:hypothetical protein
MSKHEYQTNAQECERMAENSLNPNDKDAWLQLARRWLGMIPNPERVPSGSKSPRQARHRL